MKVDMLTVKRALYAVLAGGAMLSLLYIISIDFIKSTYLLSLFYDLAVLVGYMFMLNLIALAYRAAKNAGHPLPGIFSLMVGNLKQKEIDNLNKDYQGRRDMFTREFIIMRMDLIFPAAVIFGLTLTFSIGTQLSGTNSIIAPLTLANIMGVFVLTYVIYTLLQSYLFAVKVAGNIVEEERLSVEDVVAITFDGST